MIEPMKGKERDLKLANELRENFIKSYKGNERAFEELINGLGDDCLEKLVFRLKGEEKINLYKDYNQLKEIAAEVRANANGEVFELVCQLDEARTWINDNGKYKGLVFETLYKVFKQNEKLKAFIAKNTMKANDAC